jgi:hypothetical protein
LAQLVGAQTFAALAQRFWHENPPADGDLGLWGRGLAGLIETLADLAEEPYLADVARLEWGVHEARSAADANEAPVGLTLLASHDPGALRLQFQPGFALVHSPHPVVSIWQAHAVDSSASLEPSDRLDRARAKLALGLGEVALIRREGWRVCVEALPPEDAPFTAGLLQGRSLGAALAEVPPPEFEPWLLRALREGWLREVEALAQPEEETVS